MILKGKRRFESYSKGTEIRDSREFAKRMIVEGIMSLETVSRLSGVSMATVRDLAAKIALSSEEMRNGCIN